MRSRDLGVLLVCAFAILFSFRQEGELKLKAAWVKEIDTSFFSNGHYPLESERLPKPVIADIDGDGQKEIITVTREPHLEILEPSDLHYDVGNTHHGVPYLPMTKDATLLSTVRITSGRQPVALATGYIEKLVPGKARQQVIVVVTQGWSVLCFDHNLELLWESTVPEELPPYFYQKEVAILITPHNIHADDQGIVVVGARLDSEQTMNGVLGHEDEQPDEVTVEEMNNPGDGDEGEEGAMPERHFNFYAFEGRTGAMRWKHVASPFHEEEPDTVLFNHNNFKLEVKNHAKHTGEMSWRQFRGSLLDHALPHRWQVREDTAFRAAHFSRTRAHRREHASDHGTHATGLEATPLAGLVTDALFGTPHDETEHDPIANALVANMEAGVEVIHLYTGRPLCSLTMRGGTYADINGDDVIEHIQAIGGAPESPLNFLTRGMQHREPTCYGFAEAGMPATSRVFNGTICPFSAVDSFFLGGIKGAQNFLSSTEVQTLDPLVIKRHTGYHPRSVEEFDSIFYISSGLLTSYAPNGDMNWQAATPATWQVDAKDMAAHAGTNMLDLLREGAMPIFAVARLSEYDTEEYVVVGGHRTLAIYGADGSAHSSVLIPDVPVAPAVVGDFNGDGYADIIVTTRAAHYGFTVSPVAGSGLLPMAVGGVSLMVAISLILRQRAGLPEARVSSTQRPRGFRKVAD